MNDSWSWTMARGLTVGEGVDWVERGKREKIGTTVIE